MNKIPLTANIFFSGIGAQERGFLDSELFDLKVLNTSEIDKDAVLSYATIHCGLTEEMINNYSNYPSRQEMADFLTDINLGFNPEKQKKYNWNRFLNSKKNVLEKYWLACKLSNNLGDISKIENVPYADLWTCSFPCFTGDTLVLTKEYGYIPIKNVHEGLNVLTHNNVYQRVLKSAKTGEKNIYKINAMCFDSLECTKNHKFLVRTRHRKNTHIQRKAVNYRYFDNPVWKECKDLTKDDYLGYAINQKSIVPKWTDNSTAKVKLSPLMDNEDFWWIIGRYIANGFKKTGSKIVLCCEKTKAHLCFIEEHLNKCGLNYCTDDHKSCINYYIYSNELYNFVSQFGDKACGKFIPSFVFDMPVRLCEAFLNGYWSGGGCFTNNRYKVTSASRTLIYGLGQLIAKTYHRPFSIYYTKRKPTCVTVNQKGTYSIVFSKDNAVQDKAFYSDGFIWFPINSISDTKTIKDVYDISVEENHSFTANGAIVHNCTDISVAGNMKGLNPNDKTRSSLLWENIRLLKQAKQNNTLPQYIMFENVKNLVGKKFINDFYNLLDVLDELGFHTYWSVINGKDCGIPQNRERVFALCIRKDIDKKKYNFPEPFDTGVRLIDILEDNVSEKYYLDDKKIEGFLQEFKEDIIKRISKNNNKNEIDVLGKLNIKGKDNIKRVYNPYGLSPTLNTMQGGNRQPKIIVAMRGRNPENPSDRTAGMPTKQKLEANYKGVCNTLTSVQKDNLVMEFPELFGIDKSITHFRDIDYANCLTTREDRGLSNRKGEGTAILEKNTYKIRIRKLTPTECGLLMGFTNEDVQKMRAIGISDSALYKQFGNSIITNCVELLAEHLYKAQYDDMYICTDENMRIIYYHNQLC